MERRSVLKGLGALGVGAVWPEVAPRAAEAANQPGAPSPSGTCWITPTETEGPYYFNANLLRQDIRTDSDTGEFHDGLPLYMTLTVIDLNCNPIPNVLVDIWHCDTPGVYSGYQQPGHNTVGQDFMRGIQPTDTNGQCQFLTSYPGWYSGRATHVHFKVRLNSHVYITSQWCFLDSINDQVHTLPLYAAHGINPTRNQNDGIFGSSNPAHEVMDITLDLPNNRAFGAFTIGINTPTGAEEAQVTPTDRVSIRGNYPSPFQRKTTIRYFLPNAADVSLNVFDVLGRRVASLDAGTRIAGEHQVVFDAAGLESGYYFAKLVAAGQVDQREMLLLR